MSNMINNCRLSFEHRGGILSGNWRLVELSYYNKTKSHSVISSSWNNRAIIGAACQIELAALLYEKPIYDGILELFNQSYSKEFELMLNNRRRLIGKFILTQLAIGQDHSGIMRLKINLESDGEIKNACCK
jgi:hypothetical protein